MVIYASDSGLILVVCSLLIECLLATLIWHQNLAVPATQLTPSHLPSHLTSQYALILAERATRRAKCVRAWRKPGGWQTHRNLRYATEVWPKSTLIAAPRL